MFMEEVDKLKFECRKLRNVQIKYFDHLWQCNEMKRIKKEMNGPRFLVFQFSVK